LLCSAGCDRDASRTKFRHRLRPTRAGHREEAYRGKEKISHRRNHSNHAAHYHRSPPRQRASKLWYYGLARSRDFKSLASTGSATSAISPSRSPRRCADSGRAAPRGCGLTPETIDGPALNLGSCRLEPQCDERKLLVKGRSSGEIVHTRLATRSKLANGAPSRLTHMLCPRPFRSLMPGTSRIRTMAE
jgi:hypothetical protein